MRAGRRFIARTIRATTLVVRDRRIPRPLRWFGALGLLPVPGPFDEAVLVVVAVPLFAFYRQPMRAAWRRAEVREPLAVAREESATPDLVALTRTFYERMHRDWDLDALAGFFAPDAVWDLSGLGLVNCEDWAAIREFLEEWWANWEDHDHKIEEILDLGHGGVFVAHLEDGGPIGTEARVQARRGNLFEWAQGKIVQITSYTDIDEARAAAERLAEERG